MLNVVLAIVQSSTAVHEIVRRSTLKLKQDGFNERKEVAFEVIPSVIMKSSIFWDITERW
jgi:hypothetical protein